MRHFLVGRLAEQIATKKQSSGDPPRFQVLNQLLARKGRLGTDGKRKTKPAWFRTGGRLREDEKLCETLQAFMQRGKIAAAGSNEVGQPGELRHTQGGLHVGRFEIVADVGVGVLVVVAAGK